MFDGLDVDGDADIAVAVLDSRGLHTTGVKAAQPVFSVTKMFVATAALRLIESGRLALDDEVSRRVPQAPSGITVRHLLGHTSGLPDYASAPAYLDAVAARPAQPWSLEQIASIALVGDRSAPGRFRYCNLGYWLLGAFIEEVTATPLERTLAEVVFEPAGMASTSYPAPGAGLTETGYDTRWAGPAGAAWATPADLVRFLTELLERPLLSVPSLAAMTTVTPVAAGPPWREPGYGLGLMIDGWHHTFGHGGSGPGYSSAAFVVPGLGRSVAMIARSSAGADLSAPALRFLQTDHRAAGQ
ncbi:serine hydrolase domain-containing protein [Streptomyces sp. NPDC052069]|uniref:serine hydrolase domain-containing protein n=1 Tax=Streptomyces sp. NPDC052069 TaxID=3154650 RepID=UPI00343AF8C7